MQGSAGDKWYQGWQISNRIRNKMRPASRAMQEPRHALPGDHGQPFPFRVHVMPLGDNAARQKWTHLPNIRNQDRIE